MTSTEKKSGIIIIGDEILSGRTKDTNSNFITNVLSEKGLEVQEIAIIKDEEKEIIRKVNEFSFKFKFVFTTGGIGPTHDDITALSISKAFDLEYKINPKAKKLLKKHYNKTGELTKARLKMAYMPKGSKLISNPVSIAPGFNIKNVYVFPGVPQIMQSMFLEFVENISKNKKLSQVSIITVLSEGIIAEFVEEIQRKNSIVKIGSYPYFKNGDFGVTLILKSRSTSNLKYVSEKIFKYLYDLNGNPKYL